jgi:hypothetical protein
MAAKDGKPPAPKGLKAPVYTPEQLKGWKDEQLKTVLDRAREKNVDDIVKLIEAEIADRPLFNAGRAKARRAEGTGEPSLETQIARRIADLAHDIAKSFDLSEAVATKLSEGFKGFKAHKALGSDGLAKTGGLKKEGKAQISRLTSYRIKEEIVSLEAILLKGANPDKLRYFVRAPKAKMPRGLPIADVMPELAGTDIAKAVAHFIAYEDFDEAANHYRELIAQLAPARG